tara:strand:- start:1037 stop:1363 length:327 start_codon:yes stop_codon:yes gene_type:complete
LVLFFFAFGLELLGGGEDVLLSVAADASPLKGGLDPLGGGLGLRTDAAFVTFNPFVRRSFNPVSLFTFLFALSASALAFKSVVVVSFKASRIFEAVGGFWTLGLRPSG